MGYCRGLVCVEQRLVQQWRSSNGFSVLVSLTGSTLTVPGHP